MDEEKDKLPNERFLDRMMRIRNEPISTDDLKHSTERVKQSYSLCKDRGNRDK